MAAIHINGCNSHQWLQFISMAAIHLDGCNSSQWLQFISMSAIHLNGCNSSQWLQMQAAFIQTRKLVRRSPCEAVQTMQDPEVALRAGLNGERARLPRRRAEALLQVGIGAPAARTDAASARQSARCSARGARMRAHSTLRRVRPSHEPELRDGKEWRLQETVQGKAGRVWKWLDMVVKMHAWAEGQCSRRGWRATRRGPSVGPSVQRRGGGPFWAALTRS
eukprot:5542802-Pleurochrysis_carterae.AAC.1